jgi:hypothetical protein
VGAGARGGACAFGHAPVEDAAAGDEGGGIESHLFRGLPIRAYHSISAPNLTCPASAAPRRTARLSSHHPPPHSSACTPSVQEISLLRAEALPGRTHSPREDLPRRLRCMRRSVGSWARVRRDPAYLPYTIPNGFLMRIILAFLQRPSASPGFFVLCCTSVSRLRPLAHYSRVLG